MRVNPTYELIKQMESALGDTEKEAVVAKSYPVSEEFTKERLWAEALDSLKARSELSKSSKDIGLLIKEVLTAFEGEFYEEVKARIVKEYFKVIKTEIVRGLPEWYKQSLLPPAVTVDPLEVVIDAIL